MPLALVGLALAVLVSGFLAFNLYQRNSVALHTEAVGAIADLKAERIGQWIAAHRDDAQLIGRDPLFSRAWESLLKGGAGQPEAERLLLERLEGIVQTGRYQSALLLGKDLRVRLATGPMQVAGLHDLPQAKQALDSNSVVVTDLHFSDTRAWPEIEMDVFVPLAPGVPGATPTGVLYLRVDPRKFLFPYIQSWPTSSPSAETLLARREGDSVVFVNELRHTKESPFSIRVPLSHPTLVSAQALRGKLGVIEGSDYRGVQVLGVASAVAGTDWILMSKVDRREVLAESRWLALGVGLVVALLVAAVGGLLALGSRRRNATWLRQELASRQRILDDVPAWFACIGADRRYEFHSKAYALGVEREFGEIDGLTVHEVMGEEVYRIVSPLISRALAGEPLSYERMQVTTSGERLHLNFVFAPRHAIDGSITGLYVLGTDITARKQAELALRESEELHRVLAESASDAIVIVDSAGRIEFMNSAGERMFGYGQGELIGASISPLLSQEKEFTDPEGLRRFLLRDGRDDDLGPIEVRARHRSGAWLSLEITFGALTAAGAQRFSGFIRDMTRHKSLEEEAKTLAQVVRSAGETVIVTNLAGNITYVNPAFERITGYTRDEVMGQKPMLKSGMTDPASYVAMWRALKSGESWTGRFINRRKSGELYPDDVIIFPILDADDQASGYASVQRDGTDSERDVERIRDLQRLYATLSGVNSAIVRATDRAGLFDALVRVAVDVGGYDLASVGLIDPATGRVRRQVAYGPAKAFADEVQVELADAGHALGTTARAISSGKVATTDDVLTDQRALPWRDAARKHGIRALAQLPLIENRQVIGMLGLYRSRSKAFDERETALLEGLAQEVSFGLESLRRDALRVKSETQLRKLSFAIEQGASVIMITDRHGVIEYVNPAFVAVTGYLVEEVIGLTPRVLKSAETPGAVHQQLWATITAGETWRGELGNRRKNGELYWCTETISPIRDEAGHITHFVSVAEDVSDRKKAAQMIERLAFYDVLTGVANRRLLLDRLTQEIANAKRNAKILGVLHINLDRFNNINATLGRDAGDTLLKLAAERLMAVVRDGDTVARIGGDEFCVLLQSLAKHEHAAKVASNVLAAFQPSFQIEEQSLYCTPSIGIATYPEDGVEPEVLLRNAGQAMTRAKKRNNSFAHFTGGFDDAVRERLLLEHRMRPAIERGEFSAHYQAQVDLATGRVIGMEALARWLNSEHGSVSPGQFIPIAEETGLIVPLGAQILEDACRVGAELVANGLSSVVVAVNLSARQFREKNLTETVLHALAKAGLDPSLLELEITESVVMGDVDEAIASIRALKAIGLQISIDDFGTGYSSLAYLKRLPIDKLKVDQSFVRGLLESPEDQAICRSIIALGHALGLRVIAEGVETETQAEWLRLNGCDEAQGYLFARPAPAPTAIDFALQANRATSADPSVLESRAAKDQGESLRSTS